MFPLHHKLRLAIFEDWIFPNLVQESSCSLPLSSFHILILQIQTHCFLFSLMKRFRLVRFMRKNRKYSWRVYLLRSRRFISVWTRIGVEFYVWVIWFFQTLHWRRRFCSWEDVCFNFSFGSTSLFVFLAIGWRPSVRRLVSCSLRFMLLNTRFPNSVSIFIYLYFLFQSLIILFLPVSENLCYFFSSYSEPFPLSLSSLLSLFLTAHF